MTGTRAIFLSYSSDDADAARRICDALRAAGLEVWFDQSELRGGDAWDASIRKQIKECALFIPIITPNTQAREEGYFRLEWKLAVDRSHLMADNKAFFMPVLVGDVSEPMALVPDKFRERQWSRLNDAAAIEGFAARVAKLLAGSTSPAKNALGSSPVLEVDHLIERTAQVNATPSIAVLAFANRSASVDDEYFSDGLADELLNVLAKIKGLRVAARTSAFSFKGKSATVAEIGRALNVVTVLEGSVRKSGNRARIAVQLVNVADGYHLWSETFDRTLDDIFAVQDEIAQAVVKELRSSLMGEEAGETQDRAVAAEIARAAMDRSENSEAQRLFVHARFLLGRRSERDLKQGVEELRQAVAIDPDFALAWACLAQALGESGGWGLIEVHEANAGALAAAHRALELAPNMVQAHTAMAFLQMAYQWDFAGADASIRRALKLAPDNAEVLTTALRLSFCLRRYAEAEQFGRQAILIDPLNATSYRQLAMSMFSAGNAAEATRLMHQSLELAPDSVASRHVLGIMLSSQGRHEEALAEMMSEKAEWARITGLCIVRWAMSVERGTAADRQESDKALAELIEKHAQHSAVQISHLFAIRGDADSTFAWLERAYQQRDAGLAYTNALPFFDPIRADARWEPFVKKMGLA
jgi:TolB-like protein/Tfp pilus assembly protein PilF